MVHVPPVYFTVPHTDNNNRKTTTVVQTREHDAHGDIYETRNTSRLSPGLRFESDA